MEAANIIHPFLCQSLWEFPVFDLDTQCHHLNLSNGPVLVVKIKFGWYDTYLFLRCRNVSFLGLFLHKFRHFFYSEVDDVSARF